MREEEVREEEVREEDIKAEAEEREGGRCIWRHHHCVSQHGGNRGEGRRRRTGMRGGN